MKEGDEEPAFIAETLAWCNERRVEKGKAPLDRLPKGDIGNGASCPCGIAAGVFVGRSFWQEIDAWESGEGFHDDKKIPLAVMTFVRHFDSYDLPQYVRMVDDA